jgi:polysaccharide biosynthesis protein PslH
MEEGEPVEGCKRFVSGSEALNFRRSLRSFWPALSIVAWTGKPAKPALKLGAFAIPPFRVLVLNEAGDFFPAVPGEILRHARRRLRDAAIAIIRRMSGYGRSIAWRTGERILDILRLLWSFAWRAGERILDIFRLAWSFVWRAGERILDILRLAWSFARRASQRTADIGNWTWELFLAALAYCAQWTSPFAHSAVAKPRPRSFEVSGGTFIEVPVPNRGWPRRAVMRAIGSSNVEFVVLRMRGETDHPDALIATARRTNAFAAAKQIAHSAWRKKVVTKHPFRRLQRGEVAEVFAPSSSLLVLRRETLAIVGVPRALTWGAALMILFWKASAAGLRSVAVGHDGVITDEPAMDLEDTELALRLTCNPSLARFRPARPGRFRGNVAWSPVHRREFRGKPRVLLISPYLPFPLSHGGAVRIYNICRELADRVDFVLACFREVNETVQYGKLHEVFREVYIVDQDQKEPDPTVPRQVAEYRSPAMSDLIRNFCLKREVDAVQIEYTQLAAYQDDTGAVPLILVEHDITFTLYRQLAEFDGLPETRREYDRWLEFERLALQCSNMVWTVSAADRAVALEFGASAKTTKVIPNGVDLIRFTPVRRQKGAPRVLSVGSFRHLPNLLGFETLCEKVMPAVWSEFPDAVLHVIAGPWHERAAELAGKQHLLAADPRIVLHGFVEDVRPAYNEADVVAIPLPVSAGTNIKVLEAMACGRSIVSTPAGCRGLELESGLDAVIVDTDTSFGEFAAEIVKLLGNESLRTRMGIEARRTAERRFGWSSIAEDAFNCYTDLLETPAATRSASSSVDLTQLIERSL